MLCISSTYISRQFLKCFRLYSCYRGLRSSTNSLPAANRSACPKSDMRHLHLFLALVFFASVPVRGRFLVSNYFGEFQYTHSLREDRGPLLSENCEKLAEYLHKTGTVISCSSSEAVVSLSASVDQLNYLGKGFPTFDLSCPEIVPQVIMRQMGMATRSLDLDSSPDPEDYSQLEAGIAGLCAIFSNRITNV